MALPDRRGVPIYSRLELTRSTAAGTTLITDAKSTAHGGGGTGRGASLEAAPLPPQEQHDADSAEKEQPQQVGEHACMQPAVPAAAYTSPCMLAWHSRAMHAPPSPDTASPLLLHKAAVPAVQEPEIKVTCAQPEPEPEPELQPSQRAGSQRGAAKQAASLPAASDGWRTRKSKSGGSQGPAADRAKSSTLSAAAKSSDKGRWWDFPVGLYYLILSSINVTAINVSACLMCAQHGP